VTIVSKHHSGNLLAGIHENCLDTGEKHAGMTNQDWTLICVGLYLEALSGVLNRNKRRFLMGTGFFEQSRQEQLVRYFKAGEFERAIRAVEDSEMSLSEADIGSILDHFGRELEQASLRADYQAVRRWRRRIEGFTAYCNSGFDRKTLIKPAEVPAEYSGKILLLSVSGGLFDTIPCVRSNDLHHRDILRNTALELRDLGLSSSHVHELGGAYLTSESDGTMRLWGGSDEFGPCDREIAAKLVQDLFLEKRVVAEA
jgi:hypothetical protein